MEECKVAIIADWDADGVVSAALLTYAQETKGSFPLKERTRVCLIPSGPRSIQKLVEQEKCWNHIVILDIPFTREVYEVLKYFREKCKARIYYFDHHKSTIEAMPQLESELQIYIVVGRSPTSVLLQRFLEGMNLRITPRLREFVKAIAILEGSKKIKREIEASEGIVTLAASISKALNQTRSSEAWAKYVRWIANPIPFEEIKIKISKINGIKKLVNNKTQDEKTNLVKLGIEISKTSDKEVKETARTLAMGARSLGYVKFVDARGKWDKRGTSALASAIYKMLSFPVALLVEKEDGNRLLIIRSGKGEAELIMRELQEMNIIEDSGGHKNIAVAKLKEEVTINMLEKALRTASFNAAKRKWMEKLYNEEEENGEHESE